MAELVREDHEGVAWIVLQRPERLNALSIELLSAFRDELTRAAADPAVRVLGIRGSGRCFSVGADLADFEAAADDASRRAYLTSSFATFTTLAQLEKPTLAAVHGLALGGGCELAMTCDVVVAHAAAEFGLPEVTLGVSPAIAVVVARRRVPSGRLARLALTGDRISAAEAQALGIVDVVAEDDVLDEARSIAGRLAANPPDAVQAVKRLLYSDCSVEASIEASVLLLSSQDHRDAVDVLRRRRHR